MSAVTGPREAGTVVLDIGKTNAKLTLIDAAGRTRVEVRTPNTVRRDGPYPHHDTERLWQWMLGELNKGLQERRRFTMDGAVEA